MSIKALQEYTRFSKYAKYIPEKRRRESWNEQIDRVMAMHREKFAPFLPELEDDLQFVEGMLRQKRILGSQRALQFGGSPILSKNARMYNCTVSYIDRIRFFQEAMYVLLCGCGAGFSVQPHHVNQLPPLKAPDSSEVMEYVVPDSIEGWSDAIGVLMSSYCTKEAPFPECAGATITFDYSQIRPEGSPISHGGKAPGPGGLMDSIEKIRSILIRATSKGSRRLRPIEAYDIVMHISDSVLSGGIRRSACICLFDPKDEEMVKAKTGNWQTLNPQRARSNNSALLMREETTREEFTELMKSVKEFGEPGFFWSDDRDIIYNPCLTGDTWVTTIDGPKQIKDIIGIETELLINGKFEKTTSNGFWLTGNKAIFEVELVNGMKIKATGNHKFLVDSIDGKEWKTLGSIETGDSLHLSENIDNISWSGTGGTTEEGWLIGNLIGDGTISKNECRWSYWGETKDQMHSECKLLLEEVSPKATIDKDYEFTETPSQYNNHVNIYSSRFKSIITKYNITDTNTKHFNSLLEQGSSNLHRGLIGGLFDADGSVWGSNKQGLYASISQSHLETVEICQRILSRFGIISTIIRSKPEGDYLMPDGNGGEKLYHCKTQYELRVCGRLMVEKFFDTFHILDRKKNMKFNEEIAKYTKAAYSSSKLYTSKVKSIKSLAKADVYDCTIPSVHCFDANGIVSHNCGEIGMMAYLDVVNRKETGWQFCNLCEINMKKVKTEELFIESCTAAAILGTLQAAYTSFKYLGATTDAIVQREALLGVSMTGMMDCPEIAFDPHIQRKGSKVILDVNERIANIIGINVCARATCVKPAGNSSCILGTSSGIHAHHAKRYFRHVQANKLESALKYFVKFNPMAVEESVWSANNTDVIIKFLCDVPAGSITKNQLSAQELLDKVKLTQQNWVAYGTRIENCVHPKLRHNVSNTINVKPEEWHEVDKYIYRNRHWFAGISLIPNSGDKDYPQAPFTAVHTPTEMIQMYGDGVMFASGLIVDGLRCFEDDLWKACDAVLGTGEIPLEVYEADSSKFTVYGDQYDRFRYTLPNEEKIELPGYVFQAQKEWIRRAKQFANRYFDNNIKQMTYCLKDIRNWKIWCDLKREYINVPWEEFTEDDDHTKIEQTVACAGGKCDI